MATAAAAYAGTAYFSSRRGILPSDGHLVVIYDNNPYARDPERRDRELGEVVSALAKRGIIMTARGEHDGGYTVAMVFQALAGRIRLEDFEATVAQEWHRVLHASLPTTA